MPPADIESNIKEETEAQEEEQEEELGFFGNF